MDNQRQDIVMVWYQNDWGVLGRRNEMLARTLAQQSSVGKVLHIEPPVDLYHVLKMILRFLKNPEKTRFRQLMITFKRILFALKVSDNLFLMTPFAFFPQGLYGEDIVSRLNVKIIMTQVNSVIRKQNFKNILLWIYPPHPFMEVVAENIIHEKMCVDLVDKVTETAWLSENVKKKMEETYAKLISKADIVFSVSESLCQEAKCLNKNAFWMSNAVDTEIFNKKSLVPNDLMALKKPIIGYVGTLYERLDLDLLDYLCKKEPNSSFVFIGLIENNFNDKWISFTNRHQNIKFLKAKSYPGVVAYFQGIDVGIIPHKVNALTNSMDPLKLYSYFAAGKPVVSTGVAITNDFKDYVYQANDKEAFYNALNQALNEDSPEIRQKRILLMQEHSWDKRVKKMMHLIEMKG
ncbi:MAG: glycosyltransferase [Syntrophaceae bacterium]|nr:glycosyltransferase [Syntrophaceae bacterium]